MQTAHISPIDDSPVDDEALEEILFESYVNGGFTTPEAAARLFRAQAVKSRGTVFVAYDTGSQTLLGTITLVTAESPAKRLACPGEMELHLLCVRPEARGRGLGRALVETTIDRARSADIARILLWTQPTMHSAQRLYERAGFQRRPVMDFTQNGREFLVYALDIEASMRTPLDLGASA
jgi:GNAT superfamily N-acetyltransferase